MKINSFLLASLLTAQVSVAGELVPVSINSNAGFRWDALVERMDGTNADWLLAISSIPNTEIQKAVAAHVNAQPDSQDKNRVRLSTLGNFSYNDSQGEITLSWHTKFLPQQKISPFQQRITPAKASNNSYSALFNQLTASASYNALNESRQFALEHRTSWGVAGANLYSTGIVRHLPDTGGNIGSQASTEYTRGETRLTGYSTQHLLRFSLGDDSLISSEFSSGRRIAGISLRRDFNTNPAFLYTPAYNFSSTLANPALLELYVDNQKRYSQQVNAGTVDIENLTGSPFGSDVQIRFIDNLGNEQVLQGTLFGGGAPLRQGISDFGISVGAIRETENSYGGLSGSAFISHGVTNFLTAGIFAEGDDSGYAQAGTSSTFNSSVGIFQTAVAASVANRDSQGNDLSRDQYGLAGRLSWRYNSRPANIPVGVGLDTFQSDNFRRSNEADVAPNLSRFFLSTILGRTQVQASATLLDNNNSSISLSVSQQLIRHLTLSLSGSYFESNDKLLSAAITWRPIAFTRASSISVAATEFEAAQSTQVRFSTLSADDKLFADAIYASTQSDVQNQEQYAFSIGKSWDALQASYRLSDTLSNQFHSASISGAFALSAGRFLIAPSIVNEGSLLLVKTPKSDQEIEVFGKRYVSDEEGYALTYTRSFRDTSVGLLDPTQVQEDFGSAATAMPFNTASYTISASPAPYLLRLTGVLADTTTLKLSNGMLLTRLDNGLFFIEGQLGSYFTLAHGGVRKKIQLPATKRRLPIFSASFERGEAVEEERP